jgi:hypothetical protein
MADDTGSFDEIGNAMDFLSFLLHKGHRPDMSTVIFLHCEAGKDRTGLI